MQGSPKRLDSRSAPMPSLLSLSEAGVRWKTGHLGHLGGILDSDASVGAAQAVERAAVAAGPLSSRLDSFGLTKDLLGAPSAEKRVDAEHQDTKIHSIKVCPEVDSLIQQLATGKGEFFDYVDDASTQEVGCVLCKRSLHDTALYEGRHELKVLPCFHSVCAACLQSLAANSEGDAFDCPQCGRRTQKMQAVHQYLPNFDLLHAIDSQKVAQSDFPCEECITGNRAEFYCEDCIMNLCESCTSQHRRARASTNHVLVKLVENVENKGESKILPDQVRNMHRAQFCAIHRTSRYDLYCEDCEKLICPECARTDHQQHRYKIPSPSLFEEHRQRVRDIIEMLCNQLLDDQALLKVMNQSWESSELACMQARANIAAAFDELQQAAEERSAELAQQMQEKSRERMRVLEEEKVRCSTALADILRIIDFVEKVNQHGTDVEVLLAKSHLSREQIITQKVQEWSRLCQDAPPGFESSLAEAGWSSSAEADAMLQSLASFGSVVVSPSVYEPGYTGGPLKITDGKKWADLFEEAEEAPQAIVQESSAVEVEAPGEEPHSEAEADEGADTATAHRRRRRRPRRKKTPEKRTPSNEPAWVECSKPTEAEITRARADIEMEPQKVTLEDASDQEVAEELPDAPDARRRRRRRPRGRGGKQKLGVQEDAATEIAERS
ncbi:Trim33 [Symbiodinium natans]|uniref:Trim33 protein n=1 Tax=Symbiodinium natans TaxID=878477 RepID=A0A812JIC0_9DINO|nr:Trim33 [Symbiodinium natans]